MQKRKNAQLDTRLHDRLGSHFAVAGAAAGRRAGNWQVYAAVTGSAMAMATSASAQILHAGVNDVITAQLASVSVNNHASSEATKSVLLTNGNGGNLRARTSQGGTTPLQFEIGVRQNSGDGFLNGVAFVKGGEYVGFLQTTNNFVKKLSAGATIGSKAGNFNFGYRLVGTEHIGSGLNTHSGWAPSQTGLLGIAFKTTGNAQQTDYGFVRLQYTEGTNTLANQIEVLGSGDSSATPEPATGALAILAAGALGVTALRRCRKSAA